MRVFIADCDYATYRQVSWIDLALALHASSVFAAERAVWRLYGYWAWRAERVFEFAKRTRGGLRAR